MQSTMLESITLQNFRCFDEHNVHFSGLNVVVGANNAGKSTLVEAIRLLSLVVNRYRGLPYQRPPDWTDLPSRSIGVSPAMGNIDLRGGSVFHRYGDPPGRISARFRNGTLVDVCVGCDNKIFGVIHDSTGNVVSDKSQARRVIIPEIAILPQIGPLIDEERLLMRMYVSQSIDTSLASRHFRNQMFHFKQEYFATFKQSSEDSWHNLQIRSLDLEGDPPDQYISLHVRDKDFVAEIGWMGHGLQMWLQTMWFLARSQTAEIVILDEPDVYMHADLQRRLIRLLRKRTGQTIVATHSIEIMSEVDPNNIIVVDKSKRGSSFANSLPVVQCAIDNIGGVHNIHLARLWGSKKCVHVEGKDIQILKILQDCLYSDTQYPFDTIPRLSIGGWSGWQRAIGSAQSAKESAGESVAAYCIFDSDYNTEDAIVKRYQEASHHDIRLHIWKLKEIENYLLVPEAIARVITAGCREGVQPPTHSDVIDKIEEISTTLKNVVSDALSNEYFLADRNSGIANANSKARARVEEAWRTREGRFGIISGKDVLSQLSDWAKSLYNASFGAQRVARELSSGEIHPELKAIIRSIEQCRNFPVSYLPAGYSSGSLG